MADETWINTGGTFQQPYQGQTPANAQNPEPRQTTYTVPANAQSPFTYSSRTPTTYRNPVNQQEPNIRNVQSPFTYNRQGSQPTTYQHRSPFTYQSSESAQSPFTYNHRSPTTYNHRSPSTYQFRTPSTYNFRSPSVYRTPVNAQEPNIRDRQTAYPYIANAQEPNTRDAQQPYPYIAAGQEPNIRSRQNAYPYIAAGQEPNIRNAQAPFTYNYRSPTTYSFRSPETYQHRSPFKYNHRTPSEYQHQSPSLYQFRSPFSYIARSPFTYNATGRTPFIYNASYDVSTPAIAKSEWEGSSFEDSAFAEAEIEVIVYYNANVSGDPIIVQVKADGESGNTQNSALAVPSSWTQYYNVHDTLTDHDDSPYTCKYTMTNVTVDTGTLNPDNNMTLTTSATNVPTSTTGLGALLWHYKCVSECDQGSDGDYEELNCDLNLIFEHSVLDTFTFTLNIDEMFAKSSAS